MNQDFDAKRNKIQAINYNTFLELVSYSQPKLFEHKEHWEEFIFIDHLVEHKKSELASLLNVTVDQVRSAYEKSALAMKNCDLNYSVVTIKDQIYPSGLLKLNRPPLLLFTRGLIEYSETPCVSIVGSREASDEGKKRAQKLAILLAQNNYTVVSGLALGIDTAAHTAIVKSGGKTIGVIGTTITESYPKENAILQEKIATGHLLISQFPLAQPTRPYNFPARNYTMCGLSRATVIVEAGETSGALYQARYCLQENRKLYVMKSLLENKKLTWPAKYVKRGAVVLEEIDQLLSELKNLQIEKYRDDKNEVQQLSLFA